MASAAGTSGAPAPTSYSTDPALYIYTSLTAGSSHIVTATSRLETILRANRVPFKAIDIATDEKARMLWGRRAGKDASGRVRKLPGLVQMGMVLGDLVEIEDWNEYGELKQHVTIYYDDFTQPTKAQAAAMPQPLRRGPVKPAATAKSAAKTTGTAAPPAPPMPEKKEKATETEGQKSVVDTVKDTAAKVTLPIRGIAEEAAAKAKDMRLQSLREKVYGKGGKPSEEGKVEGKNDTVTEPKGEEKKDTATEPKTEETEVTSEAKEEKEQGDTLVQNPAPIPIPSTPTKKSITSEPTDNLPQGPVGMQSPTTGAWKHGASTDDFLRTLQSPTSTSWKPTDVDEPITCYRGSVVQTVSEAEIKAIEKAEMIEEEPEAEEEAEAEEKEEEEEEKDEEDEEEEEDDDEEEEDDDEEDDDDEEEEGAQAEKKPEEVEAHEKK